MTFQLHRRPCLFNGHPIKSGAILRNDLILFAAADFARRGASVCRTKTPIQAGLEYP